MTVDVLGYLAEKGIQVKRAPGDEVHVACPFCGEDAGKRGRLYINTDPSAEIPGLMHCKLCDHRGSLVSLKRFYGDVSHEQEHDDDGYIRRALLAAACTYYVGRLAEQPTALAWLKRERGLSEHTIAIHQLGFADGGLYKHLRGLGFKTADMLATGLIAENRDTHKLADFLRGHITIPYLVSGNCVMIRGRDLNGGDRKYVTPFGQKTRLYNSDVVWDATEITLCEGELDSLVVEQLGFAAVAAPGANVWQDTWDGYFTDATRVYVVFDSDDAGEKGSAKVVEHLGSRARIVHMPDAAVGTPKNDPTEWIVHKGHTAADFEQLLRSAAGGLLVSVDDCLAEHAEMQGQAGVKFGIAKLDEMLDPGLLPSQLMVFLAKSGAGKTVWLLNLFQRICTYDDDATILFISLEQTRGDWWERARRIYRFFNMGATDADAAGFWRSRISIVDHNRLTVDQLHVAIQDFTQEKGKPTVIGLDYLGYFARSYKGEGYERTSAAVMDLKSVAKELRVPMLVPHQVSRMTAYGVEPGVDGARDSVTGDTRILLADGGYVPIKSLVGATPVVVAMNSASCLVERPATRVWCKGTRDVLAVTTQSGRRFRGTAEHPMFTADRGWVPVSALEPGDRIAVPDEAPFFGDVPVPHAELLGHLVANGAPTAIFTAPGTDVAAFIRGLWSSGGSITSRGLCHSSGSERLARDVQHLLTRFGIRSVLTREQYRSGGYTDGFYWRVNVRQYDSLLRFARKIGLVGAKGDRLEEILTERAPSHHTDLFPAGLLDEVHAVRRLNRLGWSALSRSGNPKRTSIVAGREIRRDRLAWYAEQVGSVRLRNLARSPLLFDRVEQIDEAGTEPVYDMTVADVHNFVGEFVFSNSGVVEETADFVLPMWTPDSNKVLEERTGDFRIKIGKSRHGGVGHREDLWFGPLSLAIVPDGEGRNARWARNEWTYKVAYHNTWEQALIRHEAESPKDERDFARVERQYNQRRQMGLSA